MSGIFSQPVWAQTFTEASTNALNQLCNINGDPLNKPGDASPVSSVGPQLSIICSAISEQQGGQPASSGVGAQSQPNSLFVAQQQTKNQIIEKEKQRMIQGGSGDSSDDSLEGKISAFLLSGGTTLRHRQNAFEQGYNATIPSVTAGASYQVLKNLETGLAFNYANSSGSYFNGGGFDIDSYTPLFYLNYRPVKNAFASLALGYTRQNQYNNRIAVANKQLGTGKTPDSINPVFISNTRGNVNINLYDLNFLTGYDHPLEHFTIGPRFGVDVRQWEIDGYRETSQTGLELRYNSQHQRSIQTSLGMAASFLHSFAYGDRIFGLIPQLSASWVHEYANNSRQVSAQYVQAPDSHYFTFQTEQPARNWAVVDLAVSLIINKSLQTFVNFSTVQGNRNFESYGGNIGVRATW
jgi:outer membrane autotransporter protein